jgi:hypothetical protein
MDDVIQKAKELGLHLLSVLIDLLYLVIWVYMNGKADSWIENVPLVSIGATEKICFEIVFAVSSLLPVVFYLYRDLRVMTLRVGRELENEKRRDRIG